MIVALKFLRVYAPSENGKTFPVLRFSPFFFCFIFLVIFVPKRRQNDVKFYLKNM